MSFENCFDKLMAHEGLGKWTNTPGDRGLETFSGISRRYWPDWNGWAYIDGMKASEGFPHNLENDEVLAALVKSFYKQNYYAPLGGDGLPESVALELFEMAVNCGVLPTVCVFQEALNLLNRNGKLWDDVKVDGKFGAKTLVALQSCLNTPSRGANVLCLLLNRLQAEHYIKLCRTDRTQEEFLVGWLKRT